MLQPSLTPLTTRVPPQLNLSGNQLCGLNRKGEGIYTAEGITAIANALKVTSSLTRLDVSYNSMGEGGVKLLTDALKGRHGFELECQGNEDDSDDEF